jgi:predicted N-acetyltransferase YhbS
MPLYPAAPAELPAVAALVNSAYRGDVSRQGWTTEADYIEGQRTDAESLAADLAAKPRAKLLVLRDAPDADLLGTVWLEPVAKGEAWYLGMLTVRPDLQARQLGRILLETAEAAAAAEGARRVRMTVISIRDTLIAWYQPAARLCADRRDAAISLWRCAHRPAPARRPQLRGAGEGSFRGSMSTAAPAVRMNTQSTLDGKM